MIFKSSVPDLADMHCHILPYVDDGASDFEEAKKLIREEYAQGVRIIIMTVHLRQGMFDTEINKVQKRFNALKDWLYSTRMSDLALYLSREYHCDDRFRHILNGYINGQEEVVFEDKTYYPEEEILPVGKHKCILLEFSSNKMQNGEFKVFVDKVVQAGMTPIIAHAERYPLVQEHPMSMHKLRNYGAYIQVNASAVLGKESKIRCKTAKELIDLGYADIVASDAHNLTDRPPKLKQCYSSIKKSFGVDTADYLLHDNAYYLLKGM